MNNKIGFCFFGLALLLGNSAIAQKDTTQIAAMYDLSLEDLMNIKVTSASKSSETLQDAPAVISVVTSKEIEGYGALTLVDVLNRATALYITGSYYFPNNLAAMRGDAQTHTTSHVLILLDGRPCRESFYGGIDLVIFNTFPLNAIDHIEIIRGPGSILYGTNAFSGVINIITKQSEESAVNVSGRLGSFGTGAIAFHQSSSVKDLKISTDAQYMSQRGWDFAAVDQSGIYKSSKYGQENIGVNLSAIYKNVTLRTFYGNSYRDIFGDRPIWPTDGTFNTLNTYRGFVDLGYSHSFSTNWNSTFNGTFNSFAQRSIRDLRPVDFGSNDLLGEMTHFITINNNFHITGGALANYVTGLGTGTDPSTNEPAVWVPAYNDLRWAVYAQADYKLFSKLKLIAGGQYNKTPGIDGNFVPRVGAVFNITPSFGLKALYGQAFKSAAQSEKFTLIPNSNYGNPQLKPENVATTDIQLFFQNKTFQASAGYFRSDMKDIVVRIPYGNIPGAITYDNLSQLKVYGWEAEMKASVTKAFSLMGSFAYQTNENDIGEKDITAISNTMAKGGVMFSQSGLTIGIFNSFFSKPADVINNQSTLPANRQRVIVNPVPDAFNILSANVQANLTTIFNWKNAPAISVNLYGDNLLDEKVYNPEFSRRVINSLPARGGIAFYGGVSIGL